MWTCSTEVPLPNQSHRVPRFYLNQRERIPSLHFLEGFLSKPTHFSIVQSIVHEHAARMGFVAVNHYKYFLSRSEFDRLYPTETFFEVPSRGTFYCSVLSLNRKKVQIRYLIKQGQSHYEFTKLCCFVHSHKCGSHLKGIEGVVYINFEHPTMNEVLLNSGCIEWFCGRTPLQFAIWKEC